MTPLHIERLRAGEGGGLPLLLLHGFTGDLTTWAPLVGRLAPGRAVWGLDLPGHGRSPAPAAEEAAMAASLASVAAAARGAGLRRAHWLGYSMGGRVALSLALAEPGLVASLALIGASPGLADPAARADRVAADMALAASLRREGIAAFVDRWMAQPLFASQARLGAAALAAMRSQRLANDPEALARVLEGMGTGAMPPLWERLGEIGAPVLLVAGAEDGKFAALAVEMAARLERAELALIPGAGHAAQLEAPAAVAARVDAFLRAVEAG